jgi:hypothetical protein
MVPDAVSKYCTIDILYLAYGEVLQLMIALEVL